MNTDATILEAITLGRKVTGIKISDEGEIQGLELDGIIRIRLDSGKAGKITFKADDEDDLVAC